jgi:microcystin-dependent protein
MNDIVIRINKDAAKWLAGVVVFAAGVTVARASVPYTFTGGEVLSATKLNANFANVDARLVVLESSVGAVQAFARSSCPVGWVAADGALVIRSQYPALFAAIGTTFGAGNGTTTFQLPDLRGEFVRGFDQGRGVDPSRAFGSRQISTQVVVDDDAAHVVGAIDWTTNDLAALGYEPSQAGSVSLHYNSAAVSQAVGNAFLRSVRPRNVALLYCVKT